MKSLNKTRYAILGILLDSPSSGYEIKALMDRSTAYFWRESDSTIYPMLKLLAREKKVQSEIVSVGKKKKEIFSITDEGRSEFHAWIQSPTHAETRRNEFLLKLFFITDPKQMVRLFQEHLEKAEKQLEEFRKIEERLLGLPDFPLKASRLNLLKFGIAHLALDIDWLKDGISDGA